MTETKERKAWNLYEIIWLISFSVAACIIAAIQKDSLLSLSTFITGILCVLLAAKGNIWTYVFGVYSTATYAYLSYINGLFGEMGLNLFFYVPMNVIGFLLWRKRLQDNVVEMRCLKFKWIVVILLISLILIVGLGWILSLIKGQNTPYIDATTKILSIIAMLLMVWRYRDQWTFYIILNVFTVIMWIIRMLQDSPEGIMMIVMWSAYLINAVYGYYVWTKRAKKNSLTT